MWQSLHDAWWRLATTTQPRAFADQLLSGVLQGGARLYGFAVGTRNRAYDLGWIRQARLACPVVSVGNLTVGGTGKTACVELLAAKVRRSGKRVAILSRGYGGVRGPYWLLQQGGRLLINGEEGVAGDGLADEPQLLAQHLAEIPIMVGRRREGTGRQACEQFHAEVAILDDGLQYRRLHRDCEVILINARMPLGGWPLLPRGPMREPLTSLRRADIIIMTKADESLDKLAALRERLATFNPTAGIAAAVHEPSGLRDRTTGEPVGLDRLAKSRVWLLSSIGDPEGFEQTVRRLGAYVVSHTTWPDHHRYQPHEWQAIGKAVSDSTAEALVTTEKDLIRLRHHSGPAGSRHVPVWVLGVQMRLLSGGELLDDRLARVCRRQSPRVGSLSSAARGLRAPRRI